MHPLVPRVPTHTGPPCGSAAAHVLWDAQRTLLRQAPTPGNLRCRLPSPCGPPTKAPMNTPLTPATISPVEDIVAEMRAGRMVILVDEEDRENEGDQIGRASCRERVEISVVAVSL